MSNEASSIHEFDLALIGDYYSLLERQGPGSPDVTAKALSFVDGLTPDSLIADVGCGTGGQTRVLAAQTRGRITGIDLFPTFIDQFNRHFQELNLQDRVRGQVGSMDDLPFKEGELDLIWSEGAIYNIGFERGLKEWRPLLKPGGYLAVSEASWFTGERPEEIDTFWNTEYPEINTIPHKVGQMQKAGYVPVATFILPETCWIDHFYAPQVETRKIFLEKHAGNPAAEAFVRNQQREAQLYLQYKAYYGYAFYIGKKT